MTSNNAMDGDTVRSPLRAPYGARHRERWAPEKQAVPKQP
jgi:hypothetical protein